MPLILIEQAGRAGSEKNPVSDQVLLHSGIAAEHWRWQRIGPWLFGATAPCRYACIRTVAADSASDHKVLFALDGFLSNTEELRAKLQADVPAPVSDIDLLGALYRDYGAAMVDWLAGNFVVLIAEEGNSEVHVRRDILGARTGFWLQDSNGRALASGSALLAAFRPGWREEPRYIGSFFALRSRHHPELSAFTGIQELLPGEHLHWSSSRSRSSRVPFDFGDYARVCSTSEWIEAFDQVLGKSVAACTDEASLVAAMLSGGLDSGPMVVKASQVMHGAADHLFPVSWFLSQHPASDESRWIELLCGHLKLRLSSFDGSSPLPFDATSLSEIDPNAPQQNPYRALLTGCYQRAAELGCQIILNGGMGDHLYPNRRWLLADQWMRFGWSGLKAGLSDLVHYRGWRGLASDPAVRHLPAGLVPGMLRQRAPRWLTAYARKSLKASEPEWPPEAAAYLHPDHARGLLAHRVIYPAALENLMANRYGLERRDPYQSEDLVRLMLQMPVNLSHRQGTTKWIMRRAMAGQMPEALRHKPRTGRLGSLFEQGFEKNRYAIHRRLFHGNREWQRYVRPKFVTDALAPGANLQQKNLVVSCLGYSLWREYWDSNS